MQGIPMVSSEDKSPDAEQVVLLEHHEALIRGSAISQEVSDARGYRSVTTKAELKRLGFSERQARVPALLLPIWDVYGEIACYQIRPDLPRISKGKPVKYETPRGTPNGAQHSMPLEISLATQPHPVHNRGGAQGGRGRVPGSLLRGCPRSWNWRGTNEYGGKTALSDWECRALNSRVVYIVFDSDVMEKPEVHRALERL